MILFTFCRKANRLSWMVLFNSNRIWEFIDWCLLKFFENLRKLDIMAVSINFSCWNLNGEKQFRWYLELSRDIMELCTGPTFNWDVMYLIFAVSWLQKPTWCLLKSSSIFPDVMLTNSCNAHFTLVCVKSVTVPCGMLLVTLSRYCPWRMVGFQI